MYFTSLVLKNGNNKRTHVRRVVTCIIFESRIACLQKSVFAKQIVGWSLPQVMAFTVHASLYHTLRARHVRQSAAAESSQEIMLSVQPDGMDQRKEDGVGGGVEGAETQALPVQTFATTPDAGGSVLGTTQGGRSLKSTMKGWCTISHLVTVVMAIFIPVFAIVCATDLIGMDSDFYAEVVPNQRIGIVGGGVAGLGAAWAFKTSSSGKLYKVTRNNSIVVKMFSKYFGSLL